VPVRCQYRDETAADREYAGLSRSGSSLTAVRSISIEPLKIRPVLNHDARSWSDPPTTEPSFLISMPSRARDSLNTAIDNDFAARQRRRQLGCGPDSQFAVVELNEPFDAAVNVQVFTPEISPFTCRLAPNRRLNRTAWCSAAHGISVMAIPSVFAEAGLATAAAVSGGFRGSRTAVFWFSCRPTFCPSTVKDTYC